MPANFVATSIATTMTERLRTTHKRRGISIFSGPPGIGKTTAIGAFESEFSGRVAVIKINSTKASIRLVMQHAVDAMRKIGTQSTGYVYQDANQIRKQLQNEIEYWTLGKVGDVEGERFGAFHAPPLTFVFDEAQNLSRGAIEALRYWNDHDRCYAPFPIGLVFVGNNEFSLKSDRLGQSVISAAVADRALFTESFEYADLTNADIRLFLRAHGIEDEAAIFALVKHYSAPRAIRSLRAVLRNIEALKDEADGQAITIDTVRDVLAPA
ncbi:hypothetical protein BH11PSE6_BH11PSE6_03730 [soil metagenome]